MLKQGGKCERNPRLGEGLALAIPLDEPLTYATSNNKKVYIERYGRAKDGNLHFTVFNDSNRREKFCLAFDLSSLGIRGNVEIKEMLSGRSIPVSVQKGKVEIEGELEPEDIWLLKVKR
jgi:hypothetical protein